jgi:hypothetical protein
MTSVAALSAVTHNFYGMGFSLTVTGMGNVLIQTVA